MSSILLRLGAGACLLLLLSGCAGYKLGPTNGQHSGARSVQINPFENKTIEPRLLEAISYALRKELQQDGTFHLDTHNEGDLIVSGTILKFERSAVSVRANDALSPLDLRITIHARVLARERISGKVILDREVRGQTEVRSSVDLVSAERQAVPLAMQELARSATALLVDGTW